MKKFLLSALFLLATITITAQNIPIAVDDYAETVTEVPVEIPVLINDYDPDGAEIEIRSVRQPQHGEVEQIDNVLFYTSEYFIGIDSFEYRIREVEDNSSVSGYAWVFVTVGENPDIPVVVDDEFEVLQLEPTTLDILQNDTDLNGDDFIIVDVNKLSGMYTVTIAEDSLSVIVTTSYPLLQDNIIFNYQVKEKNTEELYYSDWAYVYVSTIDNPEIPTAVDDEASTTAGVAIDIDVLNNDINPGTSTLVIDNVGNNGLDLGTYEIIDNQIRYTPYFSESGRDTLNYRITLEDNPLLYDQGLVFINIAGNPGRPVAVNDIGTGICGGETIVEVLSNDFDPDGDDIEIKDIKVVYPSFATAQIIDAEINYISMYQEIVINSESAIIEYRVQEVENPESYSDWATVTINLQQDDNFPMLMNDYATAIAGYPVTISLYENDDFNGYQQPNNIMVNTMYSGRVTMTEEGCEYTAHMTNSGVKNLSYSVLGLIDGYIALGKIQVDVSPNHSHDTLDINNIRAGINSDGYLFAKLDEVIDYGPSEFYPVFEYPKGSGKHTIFSNSLWIGGVDQNDGLHLAAQRYKQVGYDFQFGPISNTYDGLEFFTKWSRVWKVSKDEINYHRNNYWKEDYEAIDAILKWPGNGDVTNGQTAQLAPYFDTNENGLYEPTDGDYPLIRGDQTVLFIYNDDRIHTETEGGSLKVEIHGMAYGYDEPGDEMLNNTVFVHYDIYNRSENTYNNTYLGTWTDIDLGYAWDDFVGCNVELGSYYGYNGRGIDGSGEPEAYGENPPTQSITILAGPFMDEDDIDNPDGGCDYSLNGLNFGDGIADNERLGLTGFIFHYNGGGTQGDPQIAPQYYNYMKGLWKDNTSILYGGTGYHYFPGTVGPECKFMFPGASDPCNWGTDGILPNDGYNQDGKYWTEETADNGAPNPPGDRRGLGVTGPFTFEPGDRQELELAFSVGQGEEGPYSSTQQLFENLETLFEMVDNGEVIIPSDQLAVDEYRGDKLNLHIYPNPVKDIVYVEAEGESNENIDYQIYNSHGIVVKQGELTINIRNTIDIQRLEQGFYIIQVKQEGSAYSGRFIKM